VSRSRRGYDLLGVAAKAAKSTLINVGPTLSIFQPPVELITCSTLTTWLINVELIDYADCVMSSPERCSSSHMVLLRFGFAVPFVSRK
jgi:hypothetical protein